MPPTSAGYSGTPLWKKLGIKEGQRIFLIDPPADLNTMLHGALDETVQDEQKPEMVLWFTNAFDGLKERMLKLQNTMDRSGAIWVCWYKKASKKPTELSEDLIRKTALSMDLVDVKVCAVDANWSGLKLMIRKELR